MSRSKDNEDYMLLSIGIELTNICNLNCLYCINSSGSKPNKVYLLEDKVVKNIIREFADKGGQIVSLSGGEPLIHPKIFELISFCMSKDLEIYLNTNGLLLNDHTIKKLKDVGLDHVEISLDASPEIHNKLRCNSWNKVINSIQKCINRELDVGLLCVLTNLMSKETLEKFIHFAYSIGCIGVGFLRFIPEGRGKNLKHLVIPSERRRDLYNYLFGLKEKYQKKGFLIKIESPMSIITAITAGYLEKSGAKFVTEMERGCLAGRVSLNIGYDGSVMPCSTLRIKIGSIYKNSLWEIWKKSKVLNDLRDRDKLRGKCGSCKFRWICGGCRAAAYAAFGDYLMEDPGCWLYGEIPNSKHKI